MAGFVPMNELELSLENARAGQIPMPDFIRTFVESDLAVPSGGEIMSDGSGFEPLLFDKGGIKMVSCFTAKERIGSFSERAPYCLVINGKEFLRRLPPDYGLVINPGHSVGFDISPEGISRIVSEFAQT